MKHFFLLTILLFSGLLSDLFAQSCVKASWVKDFGGNSQYQGIVDGDRRPDGKFVIAGSFTNAPLTLGTITLPDTYGYNFYLAIHDSAGNFYAGSVIASGGTIAKIDVGADGSVYVCGYWDGSIIVGTDTLPNTSRKRVYVAKFDPALQFKWLRQSDWMSADCFAFDVTSDLQKNVYFCGTYEDDAFKMGDFVTANLGGWNMWSNDAFFMKFDSNGVTQYLKNIGAEGDESARTITADSLGNLYISGITTKSTGFLKFSDQLALPGSVANYSAFLTKIDASDGKVIWARMLGGFSTYDFLAPYDACLADNNSLILSGSFAGTVNVPPYTYTAPDDNAFVARFNTEGDNEWLQQAGGQGNYEYGYYCFYHMGKIAVSGRLSSNTSYCADFPLYSTLANSAFDSFNAMFSPDGKLLWVRGNDANYFSDYYPSLVMIDDAGNQLFWGSYKFSQTWYPITKTNPLSHHKTFLARFETFGGNPAFTVSAGPDKSANCGVNIQLQASTSPNNLPFGWWPNLGFSSNNTKTPNINPGKPGSYVFFATHEGCVKSDTVLVNMNNYNGFTINAGPDTELCAGDSIQLMVNSNQTGLSYSWTPNKFINGATTQNPWLRPVLPANYIVTASLGGCKAVDTVFVNVHNKPYIFLLKQDDYYGNWRTHLCEAYPQEIDLGRSENTYNVQPASLCSNISNNLITLHGNNPGGKLFVSATSPEGCVSSDSVTVVIHNNQAAPVILGTVPDRSACPGDSIQITVWLTNSIQYNFQFSWYSGWQVDSLDGQGWQDISIWDKHYDLTPFSIGYPTSTYYSRLRIPLINADMDGFRYRCYVNDYCSPPAYTNAGTLTIGPKLTQQPPAQKTLCQGINDSISVNSSSVNVVYQWQVQQGGNWVPVPDTGSPLSPNGRFLRFFSNTPPPDSTWVRCGLSGCNSIEPVYSNPSLLRFVPYPAVTWQTGYDTICPGTPDSLVVMTNSSLFAYNWYANNSPITSNNGQISGYNTNVLKFNPVFTAQATIDYKLKISNLQCGFSSFSDTTGFRVIPVPPVNWSGNMLTSCVNATPFALSGATPAGGTYGGPGVSNNIFYPAVAGTGPHILTYSMSSATPGCNATALRSMNVNDSPVVTWPGATVSVCTNSPTQWLSGGTPANGTYSGPGVSGTAFHPSTAGPGIHTLTYSYFKPSTGCTGTATRIFEVGNMANVSWPGGAIYVCESAGLYTLSGGTPANGTYSGTSISNGVFDPLAAGTGTFIATYTVTDTIGNCSASVSRNIVVSPDPIALWWGGPFNYCIDDPADSLFGGIPNGGVYSGPGVANNMFTPQIAGAGLHTITYTYADPLSLCESEAMNTIFVDECLQIQENEDDNVTVIQQDGVIQIDLAKTTEVYSEISLVNILGQVRYRSPIPAGSTEFLIPRIEENNGIIFIRLTGTVKSLLVKVVLLGTE